MRPGRYIGCEPNHTMKDLKDVKVRFALCYPDIYEIAMSYYGLFLLYEISNLSTGCGVSGALLPGPTWKSICGKQGGL